MIRLSARGKIQYQFLSLLVQLLILSSAAFLLAALLQLPGNPLALHFDEELLREQALSRFSARCLSLTILTGLVAAGLAMAADAHSARALNCFRRAWSALMLVTLVASPFVRPSLLDALSALGILAALAFSLGGKEASTFLRVWQTGMFFACASSLAISSASAPWGTALALFQLYAAYGIAALSLAFWLMAGFSAVERAWARDGLKIVAGLIFLAGSLISIAPLGLPPMISASAAPLLVICYTILGGHVYRALGMRNHERSLAPHWLALATLFWLAAGGFLGAISLHSQLNQAMQNTALQAAQTWMMSWALLAINCAYLNNAATALRGGNRRVTGYMPLWLVAFGVALSTIVQGCRGVLEIYLRDSFALDRATALQMTAPLTQVWLICLLAVAIGILIFALGFWARRPKIQVVSAESAPVGKNAENITLA